MKKLLVAGVAAAAFCGAPALAADMAVKAPPITPVAAPVYSWSGCYIGGNVGGGWANKHIIDVTDDLDQGSHTGSGIVGGGQIGCDYQVNNWVFGIQGLFDGASITGSNLDPGNSALTWSSKNSWFGTLTARIGYAVQPTTLLYAKVGGAEVRDHNIDTFAGGVYATPDTTMNGWTVGGGLEYMFAPNWSVFAEYNYLGLNKRSETFTRSIDGATFQDSVYNNMQTILFGINYRFGSR
jgi:outer membrane immunogenic protein